VKITHLTAIVGIALAAGTVVFMRSLVATNDHQAKAVAEKMLEALPIPEETDVCRMTLDYRPEGKVLQGPPMTVVMAAGGREAFGRKLEKWEFVASKALFAQRRLAPPEPGSILTFVGRSGAYRLKLAGFVEWDRPARGYPNVFVAGETADEIGEMWREWEPKSADELKRNFTSDSQRHVDRAKPLLLWAAVLTALSLLVNALFLSVEARRREIALLRIVGMTKFAVAMAMMKESVALSLAGTLGGALVAAISLLGYVKIESASFPMGAAFDVPAMAAVVAASFLVALAAGSVALAAALKVPPLEVVSSQEPRRRGQVGMLVAFACGFGAFVAVEVWGASLMSAFVPSKAWPDAVVSMLPGGVAEDEAAAIVKPEGVKWMRKVMTRQVGTRERNVLLIGAESTDRLKFPTDPGECYITSMMARARKLKVGDEIEGYRIAAIVPLNWHMVTSRSLMRGNDRRNFDQRTDGPLLVAPWKDARGCVTHLWLDYDEKFLAEHGVFGAGRLVERQLERDDLAVRLHARDEIADGTLSHGNRIIGTMARIPFIFAAVVSLGFIAMLVALADMRKKEFALLRSVGATRWHLVRSLTASALKVALVSVLAGTVFGALAGWLFTAATRAAMANWGIPPNFAVPADVIVRGAVAAIGFALAVAVPAAAVIVYRATGRRVVDKGAA
jgi:hypothetical protein